MKYLKTETGTILKKVLIEMKRGWWKISLWTL